MLFHQIKKKRGLDKIKIKNNISLTNSAPGGPSPLSIACGENINHTDLNKPCRTCTESDCVVDHSSCSPISYRTLEMYSKPFCLHRTILHSRYSDISNPSTRLNIVNTTLVNAGKAGPESSLSTAIHIAIAFLASAMSISEGISGQLFQAEILSLMEVKVLGNLDKRKGSEESSLSKDCAPT